MPKKKFYEAINVGSPRNVLASSILIVNAIVWLSCSSKVLQQIISIVNFSSHETFLIWSITFLGGVISFLVGALFADRFNRRFYFLLFWIFLGILASIAPNFVNMRNPTEFLIIPFLFSTSLGLGLPVCMSYFAEYTVVENRGRTGGIVLFLSMALAAFLNNLIATENIVTSSIQLSCLRGLSLIAFSFINLHENKTTEKSRNSFIFILKERSFILYVIPWTMFSMVNYLSAPVSAEAHGEDVVSLLTIVGNVLAGTFSIAGGLLSDFIGRKRVIITGFVMLGLGYAILGIFPSHSFWLFFYIVVDGVAWGMLSVIFLTTLWGDLALGKPSEKYYALGLIPFLLSNFLRLTLGPFVAESISISAIFSLAAFFLFLAVIPLMYAPETLPEKKMKERELKKYIERAKKIREKATVA